MKKALLIVCIVVLCFALTGCGTPVEKQTQAQNKSMFVVIENTQRWAVIYDRETRVMYAVSYYGSGSGVFTMLVNADGTPKLWKGE